MKRPNYNLLIGGLIVGMLAVMTLVSLVYTPHDVNAMHRDHRFEGPGSRFWLGTDNLGRDVFSRVMHGGRTAFFVGTTAVAIGLIAGTVIGALAGYAGAWIDEAFMRVMDGLLAFPGLIMALIVISIAGPGTFNTAVAIGVMSVPTISRIARSGFLQHKTTDFVQAARMIGVRPAAIMLRHILPNVTSSLVVAASVAFATAILSEAGLSYLGLGVQPPTPSWGRMLREAQGHFLRTPWFTLAPGLAITLTVLGFYMVGNGVRDALDVRGHHL